MTRARTVAICLLLAMLGALPRIVLVWRHRNDYFVDQGIYWSTGKLVANHVNVYDYDDNKAMRRQLFEYHRDELQWPFAKTRKQADWDYYMAGNLPLTSLVFGFVYWINSSPLALQVAFLLIDIWIAPLAFLLIRREWRIENPLYAGGLALAFGTNPAILKWGTIFPEDKGLQTVLILATLLACTRRSTGGPASWPRLVGGGVIAGLSICFKAMGVFFLPAVLAWAWRERAKKGFAAVLGTIAAVGLAINGPYIAAIVRLTTVRMGIDTGNRPNHSSLWTLIGESWDRIAWLHPNVLVTLVGVAWVTWLVRRGRIGLPCWGAACCSFFVIVCLVGGSLDRVLMGLMPLIMTLGFERTSWGVTSLVIFVVTFLPLQRAEAEGRDVILLAVALGLTTLAFATGVPALLERRFSRWLPSRARATA